MARKDQKDLKTIPIRVEEKLYNKLERTRAKLGLRSLAETCRFLLQKGLEK